MKSDRVVLFLCTGNYYRSRFAEELFNHVVKERKTQWRATSRALAPNPQSRNEGAMSKHAVRGLKARGVELEPPFRLPAEVEDDDFEQCEVIIAVDETEHLPIVQERFPELHASSRVRYWMIFDIDRRDPPSALSELETRVLELVEELCSSQ